MKNSKLKMTVKALENTKVCDINLYGDVVSDDFFSESTSKALQRKLSEAGNVDEINLYINSLGGDVAEGIAIVNILKRNKAHTKAYIDGFACSIASVIAVGCDEVIMPKNAMMMIHNCWTIAMGNANDFRKLADDLDKIMKSCKETYLSKAKGKITKEKLDEMLNDETYLTASECLEYGFADKLALYDADEDSMEELINATDKVTSRFKDKLIKAKNESDENDDEIDEDDELDDDKNDDTSNEENSSDNSQNDDDDKSEDDKKEDEDTVNEKLKDSIINVFSKLK